MQTTEHLTPRATQIMDLVIQGMKSGAIAERLGLTGPYVSVVVNAPQFKHQLAIRQKRLADRADDAAFDQNQEAIRVVQDADNTLKANAKAAADKMVALLDAESEAIQHRAAVDILDRDGLQRQTKTNIDATQTITVLDEKAAQLIKETLEQDGRDGALKEQTESKQTN